MKTAMDYRKGGGQVGLQQVIFGWATFTLALFLLLTAVALLLLLLFSYSNSNNNNAKGVSHAPLSPSLFLF